MIKLEDVFEDMVAAPSVGDAAGSVNANAEIAAPLHNNDDGDIVDGSGTTDADVLGKDCDHEKHGFLGPGCFHMPLFVTAKGRKANNKKKKKKSKNPYEKGMAIISDTDNDMQKDIFSKVQKLEADDIKKLLKTSFQTNIEDDNQLVCIVYCPIDKNLILKFIDEKGKNAYVYLEVRDGKVVAKDLRLYNTLELQRAYKSLKKPDTANQKLNIKDIELEIIWRKN